ncbi:MAG: hypothetical protein E7641_02790 [Ruminococcaceae bacterium]|nr:hypothetical protein [Oscillospiraceae bacterium]
MIILSEKPLADDLFFADGYRGFSVSAKRDSERRLCLLDGFFDYVDIDDRSLLRRHLSEDPRTPCLLRTEIGTAVIVGDSFPSLGGFCFFFLKAESGDSLYSSYARKGERLVVLDRDRLAERGAGRPKTLSRDLESVLKNAKNAFEAPNIYEKNDIDKINEKYNSILKGIVELSGCDIRFIRCERIAFSENADYALLSAFLLSSLLLCRRIGTERIADVELLELSGDLAARVFFTAEEESLSSLPELDLFLGAAERGGMFFDCFRRDGGLEIVFSPVRDDPSIYGFKSGESFDWGGDFWQRLGSFKRKMTKSNKNL